jgi:hypothetical protein
MRQPPQSGAFSIFMTVMPCTSASWWVMRSDVDELGPPGPCLLVQARHPFQLPTWQCSCCLQQFSPQPQDLGCMSNTVAQPYHFFDLLLLEEFHCLSLAGVSASGGSALPCPSLCHPPVQFIHACSLYRLLQ